MNANEKVFLMIRRLVLFAMLLTLGGCAFREAVEEVKYVPTKAAIVANAQPVNLTVIDGRTSDRNRISTKLNGYGMEAAPIRSTRDVPDIVRDALRTEFEARGFHIETNGRAVTVSVERFYNQSELGAFSGSANGDVSLTVTVTGAIGGDVLYKQNYVGTSKTSLFMASEDFEAESVAAALNQAIAKMFADTGFVGAITAVAPTAKPGS